MHRTSAPDTSVIIAVHNAMSYLGECLESIVGQTPGAERAEVIAVDDGSTDGGGAGPDRYAARHPWMRVLRQADSGGAGGPRNRALDVARGRYPSPATATSASKWPVASPCRPGEKFFGDGGNLVGTRASCGL
ncbi:glycosyltransferase [Streptomyces sp. A1136]|uniref:glycosyltransferase n=1 Tax=Streptomyces sp. A1136 TaxID=2563102 RepID=UPI00109E86FB|nr:glycosyltransferase [Streptomyces sp. A1136]THA57508.1 glycosyltransferase [Streptomyces sp. A1136]